MRKCLTSAKLSPSQAASGSVSCGEVARRSVAPSCRNGAQDEEEQADDDEEEADKGEEEAEKEEQNNARPAKKLKEAFKVSPSQPAPL